jgi:hypothetical protein
MRFVLVGALSLAAFLAVAGCKKQLSDTDAIRAGVLDHITALKTLNVSAMDINVTSVNVQGNQAQAQVEFRPKTGAPEGAGMQVSYALEKQSGNWVVKKTLATGGIIDHPAAGANPHTQAGQPGSMDVTGPPMFQDLLHGSGAKPTPALPPGHPPIHSDTK